MFSTRTIESGVRGGWPGVATFYARSGRAVWKVKAASCDLLGFAVLAGHNSICAGSVTAYSCGCKGWVGDFLEVATEAVGGEAGLTAHSTA